MKKGVLKARIIRMIGITNLKFLTGNLEEIINEFVDNDYMLCMSHMVLQSI